MNKITGKLTFSRQREQKIIISQFLQQFIYLMNEKSVRDKIIKQYCKSCKHSICYIDTFFVKGPKYHFSLTDFENEPLEKKLKSKIKSLSKKNVDSIHFTICYSYDQNAVHYVAFVYQPNQKKLIHFDPGISVYEHGQKTIVPTVVEIFYKNKWIEKNNEVGNCKSFKWNNKKTGVQFNRNFNYKYPRDSFCQTWTIFFIIKASTCKTFQFVKKWCDILPEQRETFLIQNFITPLLKTYPSYYNKVQQNLPKENYMKLLKQV